VPGVLAIMCTPAPGIFCRRGVRRGGPKAAKKAWKPGPAKTKRIAKAGARSTRAAAHGGVGRRRGRGSDIRRRAGLP